LSRAYWGTMRSKNTRLGNKTVARKEKTDGG